jgi:hypothetical protein
MEIVMKMKQTGEIPALGLPIRSQVWSLYLKQEARSSTAEQEIKNVYEKAFNCERA